MKIVRVFLLIHYLLIVVVLNAGEDLDTCHEVFHKVSQSSYKAGILMDIVYEQKIRTASRFSKVAACKYYINLDEKWVKFENYEVFTNENLTVKVDHENQTVFAFSSKLETSEPSSQDLIALSQESLNYYQLKVDCQQSESEQGKLVLKGLNESKYEELIINYFIDTYLPKVITIKYKKEYFGELESLRLRIESSEILSDNVQTINENEYFDLIQSEVMLKASYKHYQLLENY